MKLDYCYSEQGADYLFVLHTMVLFNKPANYYPA